MSPSNDVNLEETLSALMDGEVDDLELRRLLKQLPGHAQRQELLARWQRYHIASSVLHGEPLPAGNASLSQRLLAAIESLRLAGGFMCWTLAKRRFSALTIEASAPPASTLATKVPPGSRWRPRLPWLCSLACRPCLLPRA